MTDTQSGTELLPCPFCGTHATIRHGANVFWVECVEEACGAETDCGYSVEAAANIWNRRHAAQAVNFPANDDVVSALKTLINVARTINRGSSHAVRVQGDDEPQYRQRKEWVEYLLETCDEAVAKLNGIQP